MAKHPKVVVEDLRLQPALCLRGLPWGYIVPYCGTLANGVTFAIFHPEADWDYSDFRCVVGATDGSVREVAVKSVIRYRDGGTTEVETAIGHFHFPSSFNTNDKATFDGQPIQMEER